MILSFFHILQSSKEPHAVAEDPETREDQEVNESQTGESEDQRESEAQGEEESTEISKIVNEQTVHEV